jgi:hypothetical protein
MIQSTQPTRVNARARSMKGKPRRNPRGLQSSSHILLLNFSSLAVKIHSEPHFVIDPSSPSAASRPARICKLETKFKTKFLPMKAARSDFTGVRAPATLQTGILRIVPGRVALQSRTVRVIPALGTLRSGMGWPGGCVWQELFVPTTVTETLQLHYKSGILRIAPLAFQSGIVRRTPPPVTLHSGMVDWKCVCQELFTDAFLLQQKRRKGREMKPFWGWTQTHPAHPAPRAFLFSSSPAQGFLSPLICPKIFPSYLPP